MSTEVAEVDFIQAINKSPEGTLYFRVRWKGYGEEADTWEPESHLTFCKEELYSFFKDVPEALDIYNGYFAEQAEKNGLPPPTPKTLKDFAVRKKRNVKQIKKTSTKTIKKEEPKVEFKEEEEFPSSDNEEDKNTSNNRTLITDHSYKAGRANRNIPPLQMSTRHSSTGSKTNETESTPKIMETRRTSIQTRSQKTNLHEENSKTSNQFQSQIPTRQKSRAKNTQTKNNQNTTQTSNRTRKTKNVISSPTIHEPEPLPLEIGTTSSDSDESDDSQKLYNSPPSPIISDFEMDNDSPITIENTQSLFHNQIPSNKMYKNVVYNESFEKRIQSKIPPKQIYVKSILRVDEVETDLDQFVVTLYEPDNPEKIVYGMNIARYLCPDAIIDYLFDEIINDQQ